MAKNKGKYRSQKEKAPVLIEDEEPIGTFFSKVFGAIKPHVTKIAAVAVVLIVVMIAMSIYGGIKNKKASKALTKFGELVDTLDRRVAAPTEVVDTDPDAEKPFETQEARTEAALAVATDLVKDYGSTGLSQPTLVVEAGLYYDLGKYDEALSSYRAYLAKAPKGDLAYTAREGVGYSLEAKALAAADTKERDALLGDALAAFVELQPDESGEGYDRALYHQARVQALKGDGAAAMALYKKILDKSPETPLKDDITARLALLEEKGSLSRLAAVVCAGVVASACSAADMRDPIDPGYNRDVGKPVLGFLWKKVIHDRFLDHLPQEFASPAVDRLGDRDVIYIGSHGGVFHALDARRGTPIWQRRLGQVSSRPRVVGARIYVGTDDGVFYCLDTADGSTKWRYQSKGAILQPPALVGDTVVFANDADTVVALDRGTGKWRWQYERETPEEFTLRGHGGPVAVGDRIIAGFADGHLVALSAASGEVLWVRSLSGDATQFLDVDATPAVDGDTVYASSAAGSLYAIDAADGTEKWRAAIPGGGNVIADGPRLFVTVADAGLYALDKQGRVLWRQGLANAGDPAPPVVSGSYLLLSLSEGGLYIVDKETGDLFQYFDPGPGVSSPANVVDDRLYFLSNGGILYAMTVNRF